MPWTGTYTFTSRLTLKMKVVKGRKRIRKVEEKSHLIRSTLSTTHQLIFVWRKPICPSFYAEVKISSRGDFSSMYVTSFLSNIFYLLWEENLSQEEATEEERNLYTLYFTMRIYSKQKEKTIPPVHFIFSCGGMVRGYLGFSSCDNSWVSLICFFCAVLFFSSFLLI